MKQLFAVALVAALGAGAPAHAAAPPDEAALRAQVARCATVKDALQRLECYDRLARRLEVAAPTAATTRSAPAVPPPVRPAPAVTGYAPEPPSPGGHWERNIERNGKGRITKVTLRLPAASEKGGIGGEPVTLVLRCMGTETSVSIDWQNYVGENGVPVTLRADDSGGVRKLWQVSVNGSQTAYPGNAVALIRGWRGVHALHAQLNPYGGYPMAATFDLTGLEQALAPLQATCRW